MGICSTSEDTFCDGGDISKFASMDRMKKMLDFYQTINDDIKYKNNKYEVSKLLLKYINIW